MAASQIPLSWFWSLRNALPFEFAFSWYLLDRDKSESSADCFLKLKNYFTSGTRNGGNQSRQQNLSVPYSPRVSWENIFQIKKLTLSHWTEVFLSSGLQVGRSEFTNRNQNISHTMFWYIFHINRADHRSFALTKIFAPSQSR